MDKARAFKPKGRPTKVRSITITTKMMAVVIHDGVYFSCGVDLQTRNIKALDGSAVPQRREICRESNRCWLPNMIWRGFTPAHAQTGSLPPTPPRVSRRTTFSTRNTRAKQSLSYRPAITGAFGHWRERQATGRRVYVRSIGSDWVCRYFNLMMICQTDCRMMGGVGFRVASDAPSCSVDFANDPPPALSRESDRGFHANAGLVAEAILGYGRSSLEDSPKRKNFCSGGLGKPQTRPSTPSPRSPPSLFFFSFSNRVEASKRAGDGATIA